MSDRSTPPGVVETELVVTATDQQDTIEASVRRLHRYLGDHPNGWQLTLVDNGSTDATFAVIERLAAELGGLRCVRIAERAGRAALRRRWSASPSRTVAFLSIEPGTDLAVLLAPVLAHDDARPGRVIRLMTRRTALATVGGIGITALVAACGGSKSNTRSSTATSSPSSSTTTAPTTATTTTAAAVTLASEMTEGPYYLDLDLVRSDVTEDRVGAPLALTLRVLDVATGAPIGGATVDIWHADADGLYSGFVSQSSGANGGAGSTADDGTFLRGTQLTNAKGDVTFATIYPGWYTGRAIHIHVKVHVSGAVVHVGQLFFDDAFTDRVFASVEPYSTRSARDIRNANDSIYSGGGAQSTLDVRRTGNAYTAALSMGVKSA